MVIGLFGGMLLGDKVMLRPFFERIKDKYYSYWGTNYNIS